MLDAQERILVCTVSRENAIVRTMGSTIEALRHLPGMLQR